MTCILIGRQQFVTGGIFWEVWNAAFFKESLLAKAPDQTLKSHEMNLKY